jgi:hypothetical protein
MTDREAFDAWLWNECIPGGLTGRGAVAWQAWQAATAIERERCAKVCEEEANGNGGISIGPMATERGKLVFESMAVGAMNCAAAIRGTK